MMKCEKCGLSYEEGTYCPQCGAMLTPKKRSPKPSRLRNTLSSNGATQASATSESTPRPKERPQSRLKSTVGGREKEPPHIPAVAEEPIFPKESEKGEISVEPAVYTGFVTEICPPERTEKAPSRLKGSLARPTAEINREEPVTAPPVKTDPVPPKKPAKKTKTTEKAEKKKTLREKKGTRITVWLRWGLVGLTAAILVLVLTVTLSKVSERKHAEAALKPQIQEAIEKEYQVILAGDNRTANPLTEALRDGFHAEVQKIGKDENDEYAECLFENYDVAALMEALNGGGAELSKSDYESLLKKELADAPRLSSKVRVAFRQNDDQSYAVTLDEEQLDKAMGGLIAYFSSLVGGEGA